MAKRGSDGLKTKISDRRMKVKGRGRRGRRSRRERQQY